MAKVCMVVGLGFGDEGKGATVDRLARIHRASLVVRFNGGAQAGHNVVLPDGRHHCFSQFGAGTFAGARTHLSRQMMVNPVSVLAEAAHLQSVGVPTPFAGMTIDEEALVTTPFHIAVNRIREASRAVRHGSCGMGIGETKEDALTPGPWVIQARDLLGPQLGQRLSVQRQHAIEKVRRLVGRVDGIKDDGGPNSISANMRILEDADTVGMIHDRMTAFARQVKIVDERWLERELTAPGAVIFEGAQGVLLDERFGFHPHTTWSSCTFEAAEALVGRAGVDSLERVGVLRAFHTRHGAGPFPSELRSKDPRVMGLKRGEHNAPHAWQGNFRVGAFDVPLARYAIEAVGGIDRLALTCADRLDGEWMVCESYLADGRQVTQIELPSPGLPEQELLSRQEELGRWLSTVTCVPTPVPVDRHLCLGEHVSGMLGVPVDVRRTP